MNYESNNDFKEINDCFVVDREALSKLALLDDKSIFNKLKDINGKIFRGKSQFKEKIASRLDPKIYQNKGELICQLCDLGRNFKKN
ncbi:MAG: hypothetical protein F6J93_36325 [Oscillatoria sp. SIO1A7]|nr:hypothetical protein [Oscillatoria sp. SIO1A7]